MCGIVGIFKCENGFLMRPTAIHACHNQIHRGPDWSGVWHSDTCVICHDRLAIVCPNSGDQPIYDCPENPKLVLGVNGEIYNYRELQENIGYTKEMVSDCEIILRLYEKEGPDFLHKYEICGMFAFVLYDVEKDSFVVGRDHLGIIPLYHGMDAVGQFWYASEMKALKTCEVVKIFPPGECYNSETNEYSTFYRPAYMKLDRRFTQPSLSQLREALIKSVQSHLMADVPYGVLLSGGLDSSLIASIVSRLKPKDMVLHSFSVGVKGSPDLRNAKLVADFLGTEHHEILISPEDGLNVLKIVVRHVETFDVTSIRASTPMFLMARKIRTLGIKMVLSGEGADEVFGGYLYFHKAPNAEEFFDETLRKLKQLHLYDCNRANKSMMAWSVEARVPFLDRRFLDFAMLMDPVMKMCQSENKKRIEKYVLRAAFDIENETQKWLPDEILWRQKEQFSDGVGYSWIDSIQDYSERSVTDDALKQAEFRFPEKTPRTKEAYLYRKFFVEEFSDKPSVVATVGWQDTIACSTETAVKWDESFRNRGDASGRAIVDIHNNAYSRDLKIASQKSS